MELGLLPSPLDIKVEFRYSGSLMQRIALSYVVLLR